MSKKDEALRLALETLKQIDEAMPFPVAKLAQKAIREALAEQPAQRKPLTDEQIRALWDKEAKPERSTARFFTAFARAIEAAHGITGETQ